MTRVRTRHQHKERAVLVVDSDEPVDQETLAMLQAIAEPKGLSVIQGKIEACPVCEFFDCVCGARRQHKSTCLYLKALTCPVAIACEPHGRDVCPVCDLCDCGAVR